MERIPLIALTGGPCAGKSSAMVYLIDNLRDIGIGAVATREQATNFFTSGITIPDLLEAGTLEEFQIVLTRAIINEENVKRDAAALLPHERKVVLCDRGILDNAAYSDPQAFAILLHDFGMSQEEALARYEAVMHLMTAADGAEAHYNLDNEARNESPAEARELDKKTQAAWIGHEHWTPIPNFEKAGGEKRQIDFDRKLRNLYRAVCHQLGVPTPLEIERKFLVRPGVIGTLHGRDLAVHGTDIRQVYLAEEADGTERRIRARMQPDGNLTDRGTTYSYTEKRRVTDLVRNESSRQISLREYVAYESEEADSEKSPLAKRRYNFVDDYTYFHLDVFQNRAGLVLLEVEFTEESAELELPDWIAQHVVREVTDDPRFKNASIATANPIVPSNK